MNTQELLNKRANVYSQMADLQKRALAENRNMSQDEENSWNLWDADYNSLTTQIQRQERMEKLNAEQANPVSSTGSVSAPNYITDSTEANKLYRGAMIKYIIRGAAGLEPDEVKILKRGWQYQGNPNLPFSDTEQRGTSTQSTTGNLGGYTIPTGFLPEIEARMKLISGIMNVATIMYTASGNTMTMPTYDDTAGIATLVTEGTTTAVADITFAQKQLDAYVYRSLLKFSEELMEDSAFNIEAELTEALSFRFGRAINLACTTGTGSSQPNGVVTASTLGKTAASTTVFTRDELLDLLHSVDPVYRNMPGAGWMFHDTTLKFIKKLAIGTGDATPLWQGSVRVGEPDTLEGRPYYINQDMSSTYTAANKLVLYGDFSKYRIRMVRDMQIRRLDELYALTLEKGLLAFARFDGELLQANAVNHLILAP